MLNLSRMQRLCWKVHPAAPDTLRDGGWKQSGKRLRKERERQLLAEEGNGEGDILTAMAGPKCFHHF